MLNLPSADFKFILLTQDGQSLNLHFRRLERTIASLEDTFIERVNDLEMGIGNRIAHELAPLLRTRVSQQPLQQSYHHPPRCINAAAPHCTSIQNAYPYYD
jgi:hypothetical protein